MPTPLTAACGRGRARCPESSAAAQPATAMTIFVVAIVTAAAHDDLAAIVATDPPPPCRQGLLKERRKRRDGHGAYRACTGAVTQYDTPLPNFEYNKCRTLTLDFDSGAKFKFEAYLMPT